MPRHIDLGDTACMILLLLALAYILWHMVRAGWI
jgi:hypothetical protein